MPVLIDLLDQYLFSDAPGLQAHAALRRAWVLATNSPWDELYIDSLDDALTEELPHLSAFSGRTTRRPSRPELAAVLATDLGDAGAAVSTLDQSSRAFLTELARAMQARRLITINNHNLFTDEYRQILLNLFDHAHIRFQSTLTRTRSEFSAALATATGYDSILAASISTYLERQFGVKLESLNLNIPTTTLPLPEASPDSLPAASPPSEPETEPPSLPGQIAPEHVTAATPPPEGIVGTSADASVANKPITDGSVAGDITSVSPHAQEASIQPVGPVAVDTLGAMTAGEPITETTAQEIPAAPVQTRADSQTGPSSETPPAIPPAAGEQQPGADAGASLLEPVPVGAEPEPVSVPVPPGRMAPNRLRVLLATPADVQSERQLLVHLITELDARSRARFGLELVLVHPSPADEISSGTGQSLVELADIFIGVVWLQFGTRAVETNASGTTFFAGTQNDFARALEQGSARDQGWLRTVIYRSIRPPLDLLHLNITEYGRVQQFFERASAYTGDDLVRVYADASELVHDVRARLDAWIFNYAGDLASALGEYGRNAELNGPPSEALTNYEQAIALYRELDMPSQELELWLRVGAVHQRARSSLAASVSYDTALRLARRVEEDSSAARALRALGNIAADDSNWQAALRNYQQARGYLSAADPSNADLRADELVAHEALGDAAHTRGEIAAAQVNYRDALAVAQELGTSAHIANVWNKLANLSAQQGDWQNAISAYDAALEQLDPDAQAETRRAILDTQAHAHAQIASHAASTGDTALAQQAYRSALDANTRGSGDRALRIEWFTALGELASARSDWEQGIEAYGQALALLDSPTDADARRELLTRQAQLYQQLGSARTQARAWDAATDAYRDALALYQELDVPPLQGTVLFQLGEISASREQWQEANAYYTEALPRLDVTTNTDLRARALRAQADALAHIGDMHLDARQWGQAEIAYVQARGDLEQIGAGAETGVLLARLGTVTAAQSRLPEALAYFQQARGRLPKEGPGTDYRETLRGEAEAVRRFADMYRGAGDFQSAQAHYRQQLELAQELQDNSLEADAFHSLGLVAADQSQWDDAIDLYDQALTRATDPADERTRAFVQRHQLAAYEKLGERERAAQHLPQAELAYRSALTLAQGLSEREREADLLYTLGLIAIEHENWDDALADLRRALGIYNLLPSAPNKPRVIWNIGRAQRGQKHARMVAAFDKAQAEPTVESYTTALQLAREVGDVRTASIISEQLGAFASERADWDTALAYYDDALGGFTEPADSDHQLSIQRARLSALRARSERARLAEQWTNADADLFIALDIARSLDDLRAQGELVYRRGLVAAGQARWNEAIDLHSDALSRLGENDALRADIERAQADAYQGLGDAERQTQNWEAAEAAYAQALALERSLGAQAPQARLLANLGDVATRQARWSDALDRLTQARQLALALDTPEQLEALDADIELATRALKREQQADAERQGDAKRAAQDYASAAAEYSRALAFANELQDRAARAELHAKLGFVATERGAHADALEQYRIAAALHDSSELAAQRAALVELQAQALQELGNRAGEQGDWQGAFGNYSQAIALLDAPTQSEQRRPLINLQAVTLQNVGDEARVDTRWNDALDAYRRAAGLFALVGASHETRVVWEREAHVLAQLGQAAHSAGNLDVAQEQYALAVSRLSEAQAYEALRRARAEQMLVLRDAGDAASAPNTSRRFYRQALSIAEELDDRLAGAELYRRLGQLAARQQDWQSALLSYQYALDRAETASDLTRAVLRDQQLAHQELGTAQRIAGDFAAAESNYSRAYANAQAVDDTSGESELAFLLGMLSADQNAWESALGYYQRALDLVDVRAPERADVLSYQAIAYQRLGDARRAQAQYDAASSAYASGLKIADERGDDERGAQILYRIGLLDATRERWQDALDAYARAERRLGDADSTVRAEIQGAAEIAAQAIQRAELAAQMQTAEDAYRAQDWAAAVTAYQASIALAGNLQDSSTVESLRHSLVELHAAQARAFRARADWDAANQAYRSGLNLAREFNFAPEVAQRERDLISLAAEQTNSLRAAQDWENAERAAQAELEVAQEFSDANAQSEAYYGLGVIAAEQGKWNDAKTYYEQARPLLVQLERTRELVALDADLATVNDILKRRAQLTATLESADAAAADRDFAVANAGYRSAHTIAAGLGDDSTAAHARSRIFDMARNRTDAHRAAGELDLAERSAQEQFAVAREFDDPTLQGAALAELGSIAADQQRWSVSKAYLEQARPFLLAGDHTAALADLDATLARVDSVLERQDAQARALLAARDAHAQRNYPAAILSYRRAFDLANSLNDRDTASEIGASLVALTAEQAGAAQSSGDLDAASRAQHTALATAHEFDDSDARANALYNLGLIASARRAWQVAKIYFEQARPLLASSGRTELLSSLDADLAQVEDVLARHARLAQTLTDARAALDSAQFERAISQYRTSLELARDLQEDAAAHEIGAALVATTSAQAKASAAQGDWDTALGSYRTAIAVAREFNDAQAVSAHEGDLLALAARRGADLQSQKQWTVAGDAYRQALALADEFDRSDARSEQQANLIALALDKTKSQDATRDLDLAERAAQEQFAVAQEFSSLPAAAAALHLLGKYADRRGDLPTAHTYLLQAAQTYEQAEATADVVSVYDDLNRVQRILDQQAQLQTTLANAEQAHAAGQLTQAASEYQAALSNDLIDPPTMARAHMALGSIAATQEQWQQALREYDLAAAQYDSLEKPGLVAGLAAEQSRVTTRLRMAQRDAARARGDAALSESQWDDASTAYQQGLELAQQLDDTASVGEFQLAQANVAHARRDWQTAADLYATAADTLFAAQSTDLSSRARVFQLSSLTSLADDSFNTQDWDTAHAQYERALSLAVDTEQRESLTYILQHLGSVATGQNDLVGAISYLDRALTSLAPADADKRSEILHQRALLLQRLGDSEMDAHDVASAETAYEKSLADLTELGDDGQRAEVLHSLGLVRGAQSKWQAAREAHQEAYSLVQGLDVPSVQLGILSALAGAQKQLGEIETARENYSGAAALAQALSDTASTADIESALGDIAASQAHWQQALEHYDAARHAHEALGDTAQLQELAGRRANILVQLGDVMYGEGQWTNAASAYAQALELDAATGRTDRDSSLHYSLGLVHAAQYEYADAVGEYDRAIAGLSDPAELVLRDRILAHLAIALQQQAKRDHEAGDLTHAEARYTRALKMAEASDNFDQVADLWFRLGNLHSDLAHSTDALDAYRRAYDFDLSSGHALLHREISVALANTLLQQGKLSLAGETVIPSEAPLQEALTFAEQSGDPQLVGTVLRALGDAASRGDQPGSAIEFYARAGRTFASIEDMPRWREVSAQQSGLLRRVASSQVATSEFSDAENLYRRALLLDLAAGETPTPEREAETHFGLGRALLGQARYDDALAEFEQANALFAPDAPERANLYQSFADALEGSAAQARSEMHWDRAHVALLRAANYRDELDQRMHAGLDWSELAEIAAQRDAWQDAVDANEQALARLDSPDTVDERSRLLQRQAQILAAIGDQQQNARDWENASTTFRRALAIAQEQGDLATLAQLYTLLGSLAAAQEHWDDASTEYHHAQDVYQELNQPGAVADTWAHLGDMHRQAAQYEDAAQAFEHARDLYRQTNNRLSEGAMLERLGHVEGDREAWDNAIDQYQAAIHLYNESDARRMKAQVYRALERAVRNAKLLEADQAAAQGDSYLDSGAWMEAENAYREAEDLYGEAEEHILRAQMQNQIGVALEAQMRFDDALDQYQHALTTFRELNFAPAEVSVLANIGDAHRNRRRWEDAVTAYRQALQVNAAVDDVGRRGELQDALGQAYEGQGDWTSAIEQYEQAVNTFAVAGFEAAREAAEASLARARSSARAHAEAEARNTLEQARASGNLAEEGEVLNTLGLMAAEDQKWSAALDYYRQAVTAFERLESRVEMESVWRTAQGTILANIGDVSQQIGAWRDADYAYTRALGYAREIGDRESEAVLLANLGVTAQEQAELPRALDLNMQALDTYRALGEETPRVELLERVGDLQLKLEQATAAENTYREALDAATVANDTERTARLAGQLGLLAESRGADDEALAYYQQALALSTELADTRHQQLLLTRQGALHARASRWQDAETAHHAALALAGESGDELARAEIYVQLAQGATARGDWRIALDHALAARVLYGKLDAPREQYALLKQIAAAHIALGEYSQADSAFQSALELAERIEDADSGVLWAERATLAEKENRWQAAAALYENALDALSPAASSETRIHLLFRRGDAALRAHAWSTADSAYNDALEVANASDNRVQYGWGINRLGLLAQAQREWDEALENFQEAIEILRSNEQPLGEARVLNNIAQLKMETGGPAEANLFAQAALTIAQSLGSDIETSRSLYLRGLVAFDAQEFEPARRFFVQAIAASPANWAAQLQLGNTLLATGNIPEAVQQAEAALGQAPDWELGAQTQLTIASLYQEDTRQFKSNLKRTRVLLNQAAASGRVAPEFAAAVELVLRAMEGSAENALTDLDSNQQPALSLSLEAQRFARAALLALSKSPRRFKGKPALVTYFAPPKPRARKTDRRRGEAPRHSAPPSDSGGTSPAETLPDDQLPLE